MGAIKPWHLLVCLVVVAVVVFGLVATMMRKR
jgi:Sec-independent protein translocase protein TatA